MFRYFWLLLLGLSFSAALAQDELYSFAEEGFVKELVPADVGFPTGITFDADGTGYIWTKAGMVYRLIDGVVESEPWIDLHLEVADLSDHGLLGFALDVEFGTNGFVYLLYTVDRNFLLHYGTDEYIPDANAPGATIGRLTRYTAEAATDFATVDLDSRLILIGQQASNGIPLLHGSHGVGTVFMAPDRSLLVTCGDGSTYLGNYGGQGPPYYGENTLEGLADGIITPEQEVGSFRAQQIQSLNGSVLRISAEDGSGLTSNPFYNETNPNAPESKIWAYGFRNPFRLTARPGSGSLLPEDGDVGQLVLCDVGAGRREEVNVISESGGNYGWPLREGIVPRPEFMELSSPNPFAANPLAGTECEANFPFRALAIDPSIPQAPHINPCDGVSDIEHPLASVVVPPTLSYRNKWSGSPGDGYIPVFDDDGVLQALKIDTPESGINFDGLDGFGAIGGQFYMGSSFPQDFHELYFMADYEGWIRAMEISPSGDVLLVREFLTQIGVPVYHLEFNPAEDAFYMLEFPGLIHKLYAGQDVKPVANLAINPPYGPGPLGVHLDASASSSPIGLDLTFDWLVEGIAYTGAELNLVLGQASDAPHAIPVLLTVTDTDGNVATASGNVSINNTPPTALIAPFSDGEFYPMDGFSQIPLTAWIDDQEQTFDGFSHHWQVLLHHNSHYHIDSESTLAHTATNIAPLGCEDEADYWYRLRYVTSDGAGLTAENQVELFPHCGAEPIPYFTSFDVAPQTEGNALSWSHTTDGPVESVVVFRGADAYSLYPIDTVLTSSGQQTYLDQNIVTQSAFYAVKLLTPFRGFRFSETEKATNEDLAPRLLVSPNPASNVAFVQASTCVGDYTLELVDNRGRRVRGWEGTCTTHLALNCSVAGLVAGTYHFHLVSAGGILTATVLVSD